MPRHPACGHSKNPVLSHPDRIVIATRQSRLALWQAEHVRDRLRGLFPDCRVELLALSTRGDEILDTSLAKIGGKGLFVKELELALAEGRGLGVAGLLYAVLWSSVLSVGVLLLRLWVLTRR